MAKNNIVKIEYTPSYIYTTDESGNRTKHALANMLVAGDIPAGLTYVQVASLKALANLIAIIVRTLIAREILDETFDDEHGMEMDLAHLVKAIEDMRGSYHEPTLASADD